MPLYEYKCDKCGGVFEVIQKFSDAPILVHEDCGGPLHKLVSVSALQFKGTGFYITDYAKGSGSSSANGKESKSSEKGGDSDSKSSESKPSVPASTTPTTSSTSKES